MYAKLDKADNLSIVRPSPIRTITVGFGFSPISTGTANNYCDAPSNVPMMTRVTGLVCQFCTYITVGRDFHPAPKVSLDLIVNVV